ncbi:hypothetical protein JX265_006416 [Neoarthrinium moseri]|uniref:Uncharacterized protein n=2 Tax=Neoarthrinium moseri TaxID=1658444 RepID=A0A9Q0APR0_9PEZI|nr:hypothetical protein JX266_002544 [Neoarthrinium moseri]KAI1870246.1 hypothetical protein JX265_006416 [Neoarthrinium moseri]
MAYSTALFFIAGVAVVMEVYCLLALQFCEGEDLMSLYWSTWTMLQLGSEIAVLGVVLALYHALTDIRHPKWALALGTPVLVVAGFGHLFPILAKKAHLKFKFHRAERRRSRSGSQSDLTNQKTTSSSATSIKQEVEERSRANSTAPTAQAPRAQLLQLSSRASPCVVTFEIDVGGHDDVVSKWPSFLGIRDGKALIQATVRREHGEDYDVEAQRPA